MSLLSFIKDAGEKLFHYKENTDAQMQAEGAPNDAALKAKSEAMNAAAAVAIVTYIHSQNLDAKALDVKFDGATSTVSVYGVAKDQATREKIVLCCGNVAGVAAVNDRMEVEDSGTAAKFYTVKSGDTLSKIAKAEYGDAGKYPAIFEANKPMLKDPDKIYPGQQLRIPAQV